ncbi:hypothetical protein B0H10DRAFT_1893567, partial [Mycena sp. CBHHK59/15]
VDCCHRSTIFRRRGARVQGITPVCAPPFVANSSTAQCGYDPAEDHGDGCRCREKTNRDVCGERVEVFSLA